MGEFVVGLEQMPLLITPGINWKALFKSSVHLDFGRPSTFR
jgi:hypothetical protein